MRTYITSDHQYVSGTLDPCASIGKGTIIEYVVMKTLKDCWKERFNFDFDLRSSKYGSINVKSSSSHYGGVNPTWRFIKPDGSFIPDYYICVGLDGEFKQIHRVWIIPGDAKIVKKHGIIITDSIKGREKALEYEVDPTPYKITFKCLDITSLPEFRNIHLQNFQLYKKIITKVKKGYPPIDLIDDYGIDHYQDYLTWVKNSNLKKCFNLYNGSVCIYNVAPGGNEQLDECFVEITASTYPIYDYSLMYTGYVHNGYILKPATKTSEHKLNLSTVQEIIRLYTMKYGQINIEDLEHELSKKQIDTDNLTTVLRKLIHRGDLLKKSQTEYYAIL